MLWSGSFSSVYPGFKLWGFLFVYAEVFAGIAFWTVLWLPSQPLSLFPYFQFFFFEIFSTEVFFLRHTMAPASLLHPSATLPLPTKAPLFRFQASLVT